MYELRVLCMAAVVRSSGCTCYCCSFLSLHPSLPPYLQLDVWDTGGSERFRTLTRNYYNFASVIILVYDASKPSSLTNLVPWMEDARIYSPTAEFVLMGNVVSDEEESIDPTSVDAFAELHGIKAKCKIDIRSGESVHKAFELAASYIHRLKNRRYFEESGSVHLYTENVRLMPAKKNKCPSCCVRT